MTKSISDTTRLRPAFCLEHFGLPRKTKGEGREANCRIDVSARSEVGGGARRGGDREEVVGREVNCPFDVSARAEVGAGASSARGKWGQG